MAMRLGLMQCGPHSPITALKMGLPNLLYQRGNQFSAPIFVDGWSQSGECEARSGFHFSTTQTLYQAASGGR